MTNTDRNHDAGRRQGNDTDQGDDLCFLSATELAVRYRARTLSPIEVTRATLDRIDRLNSVLNAYCLVDHERALAAAQRSEQRWRDGKPLSRIDGVPTSIKDLILTRGWPTLRGSKTVDPHQPWDVDAPATARLREAGAVLLGKTTTPEFGWRASTDSALTGITRNPWDRTRTPGGSSGGAAASVAAGMGAPGGCRVIGKGRLPITRQPPSRRHRRRRVGPHPRRVHRNRRDQAAVRPGAGLAGVADGHGRASGPACAHRHRRRGDARRAGATGPT